LGRPNLHVFAMVHWVDLTYTCLQWFIGYT